MASQDSPPPGAVAFSALCSAALPLNTERPRLLRRSQLAMPPKMDPNEVKIIYVRVTGGEVLMRAGSRECASPRSRRPL